ncbi:MAG: PLP-dependent transferase [Isosphaeraceae bacterium]|nr:PLP-dependent transferase [Isosphaeraceae bacterium]
MPDRDRPRPHPDTMCARPTELPASATPPLSPPLQLSSVYEVADLALVDAIYERREAGYIYARDAHPNATQLASKLAALEGAEAALICGSGMAAEAAVFLSFTGQGRRVALSEGLYGRTGTLVEKELSRFGVACAAFDPTRPETLRPLLDDGTGLVFLETITNPLCRVADLTGIVDAAKETGATVALDHTFAPLLCRPIELGVDLVIHSCTKLIGGHCDVTLGCVAGRMDVIARLSNLASTFGLTGNPFDSWLALRGVSTLALRVERTSTSALEIARRLEAAPAVRVVNYPGLASHPDHGRASTVFGGRFGAMMSFDLGSRESADRFIRGLEHIPYAPSFGDVSTTLSHPTTTSHRYLAADQRERQGIGPGLIRLSVGLEAVDDIWSDLESGLTAV